MAEGKYIQVPTKYDNASWTQAAATNYDVSAQTLFVNCKNPKYVSIRTDQTITVKFNSTSNPAITVSANTELSLDFMFQAMYVTTTTDSALKILFLE
jgi:hypothetical protein